MRNAERLTAGKLAKAAGIGVETLRFYEREGVLAVPARSAAGYRIYDTSTIDRIRFIQRAQALGFTLREIRELIAIDSDPDAECNSVRERAIDKLGLVQQKIDQLEGMKRGLGQLIESCKTGQPVRDCPVMRCLSQQCAEMSTVPNQP